MEATRTRCRRQPLEGRAAKLPLLALTLLLLAGCAAGGKGVAVVAAPPPAPALEPSVIRAQDGREGFVIREIPELAAAERSLFERGVALLEQGRYQEASDLLAQVVETAPQVTAPYIDLALAYRQLEKFEPAEAQLKKALEIFPRHPVASNAYGLLLRKTGRFAEARTVYEEALTAFPDYYPLHRNLGILLDLYLNDPASALKQYELYARALPDDGQVAIWIADLHNRLGL